MPNGFHGSKAQWERIESPLRALDGELDAFSARYGIPLSRNQRNWPDRSLTWGEPVRRLIQIYLADEEQLTYNVWLCASEDRGNKRYWKRQFLKEKVPASEIADCLKELLERGRALLETWDSDTLEFATTISTLR
jgi:hypothetical protein